MHWSAFLCTQGAQETFYTWSSLSEILAPAWRKNSPHRARMIKFVFIVVKGSKSGIKHHFKASIHPFTAHRELLFPPCDAPCILWQINNATIELQTHTNHPAVSGFLHLSDINHFTKYDCLRTIKKMRARSRCQTQITQHFFNS